MSPKLFGDLLYGLIRTQGLTVAEFSDRVGYPIQAISNIRHGHRPMPLDRLEVWADVLGLTGAQRESFLDAGALTHCPQRITDLHRAAEGYLGMPLRSYLAAKGDSTT